MNQARRIQTIKEVIIQFDNHLLYVSEYNPETISIRFYQEQKNLRHQITNYVLSKVNCKLVIKSLKKENSDALHTTLQKNHQQRYVLNIKFNHQLLKQIVQTITFDMIQIGKSIEKIGTNKLGSDIQTNYLFQAEKMANRVEKKLQSQNKKGSISQRINDPFFILPNQMAEIGLITIEKCLQPFLSRDAMSLKVTNPEQFDDLLNNQIPFEGNRNFSQILQNMQSIFASIQREDHPGFVGYTQGYANFISCIGQLIKSSFNPLIPVEWTAPGFNSLQQLVVKWLCKFVGYQSQNMGGHCVSGGSEANQLCLAAAVAKFELMNRSEDRLHLRSKAVIYASDASHQCILGAANNLGFDKKQVIFIPIMGPKDHFKINKRDLKQRIKLDRIEGRIPIFLSGCAGSTFTAAYEDFVELAQICRHEQIWLHGDGAWGGASLLIAQGKNCLKGSQFTDSFVVDPHKGLYEPYGLGVALVKEQFWLKAFFSSCSFHHKDLLMFSQTLKDTISSTCLQDYLNQNKTKRQPHNMKDYGRQLTQPCKVIGFYMAMNYFGFKTYQAAVQLSWDQAEIIQQIFLSSGKWRVLIKPRFSMLTIQYFEQKWTQQEINNFNESLIKKVCRQGIFFPNTNSFTDDNGCKQVGIRIIVMNPMADDYPQKIFRDLNHTIVQMKNQLKI